MTRPDPAWLDRMYNNRALVPEHAAHFSRWAQTSAQARSSQPCTLDLAYGASPGEKLDVFPAARATPGGAPVVVFVHGGYWRSLDKADHSFVAPAFVDAGALVVVLWYLFASPKARYGGRWMRPIVKVLVFTLASVGLWVSGHENLAIAYFASSVVINALAMLPSIRVLVTD